MLLDVIFFALYRERAGSNKLQFELPEGGTVADLTTVIRQRIPGLAPPDVNIVVAVNAERTGCGLPVPVAGVGWFSRCCARHAFRRGCGAHWRRDSSGPQRSLR